MPEELSIIGKVIKNKPDVHIFALVSGKNGGRHLCRPNVDNETMDAIRPIVISGLKHYQEEDELKCDKQVAPLEEFEEKTCKIYETATNLESEYICNHFRFLKDNDSKSISKSIDGDVLGFFFKVSSPEHTVWSFQNLSSGCITNTKKAIFSGSDKIRKIDDKVYQFTDNISFVIIDGNILFRNIKVLQNKFGFDSLINMKAKEAIKELKKLDILSDVGKLESVYDKKQFNIGKKLMRVLVSSVINIPPDQLRIAVQKSKSYGDKIKYDQEGKIKVTSEKDVNNVLKLLNDQILLSEITNNTYDTSDKILVEGEATNGES